MKATKDYKYYIRITVNIIAVLLLTLSISCVEEVRNVNLPSSSPKLVVFSMISPEDSVKVKVHKSAPVFEETFDPYSEPYPPLTNAEVILSDDLGNEVVLPYQSNIKQYAISPDQFLIESGNNYNLKVSVPGFKTVTAHTTIPENLPQISKIIIDSVNVSDYYSYYSLRIKTLIQDYPNLNNYYRVQVFAFSEYSPGYPYSVYSEDNKEIFSDIGYDGKEISFTVNATNTYFDSVGVYAYSIDLNYFHYYKTLLSFDGENPFTEPVPVYSNISNGLGVFGSYFQSIKYMKVEK